MGGRGLLGEGWGGGGDWPWALTSTVMTSTRTAAELLAEAPPRHSSTTLEMLRCPMSSCMYLPARAHDPDVGLG